MRILLNYLAISSGREYIQIAILPCALLFVNTMCICLCVCVFLRTASDGLLYSLRHDTTQRANAVPLWTNTIYLLNTFEVRTQNVHDGFKIISNIVKQLVKVNALFQSEIYTCVYDYLETLMHCQRSARKRWSKWEQMEQAEIVREIKRMRKR